MNDKITILGSGSWATAIAKILHLKNIHFTWYIRNAENIKKFITYKHNPNYLTGTTFDINKITFSADLKQAIFPSNILILAIPSIHLEKTLAKVKIDISEKKIISAIKGMIPSSNMIISEFLAEKYNVNSHNYCILAGPTHSEEIALERFSFLTIVGENQTYTKYIANLFNCSFIKTSTNKDVKGIEYAGILKNIMAIAVGICHGLNFGNNFIAVLITNAIKEMERFLVEINTTKRDIKSSPYLGDLLTTTYSKFSRNRTFGTMIGKGYSCKTAILEMNMVVEGYYALKHLKLKIDNMNIDMPIINTLYDIIYEDEKINIAINKLMKKLK